MEPNEQNDPNERSESTRPDDTPASDAQSSADAIRAAKKKKKRIMLTVILVITVLACVSYILTDRPDLIANLFSGKNSGKGSGHGVTSMYSDELYSYVFYPSNYDLDPTKNAEYMGLDRQLWYHHQGLGIGISLDDEDALLGYNDAVAFFARYFRTVIAGDVDTYNTYFTDRYYKNADPYELFTPQMLYDIHVTQLTENQNSDGTVKWTFDVEYKIYHNDGTFRNDIPSDASKKLIFTLTEDITGTVRIDEIDYYRRAK